MSRFFSCVLQRSLTCCRNAGMQVVNLCATSRLLWGKAETFKKIRGHQKMLSSAGVSEY